MMIMLGEATLVTVLVVTATAYCACASCTAPYNDGITASGTPVEEGVSTAAGEHISLGTDIYLEENGPREVDDRGSAITNGRIDVYKECHDKALQFGVQERQVWIVRKEE